MVSDSLSLTHEHEGLKSWRSATPGLHRPRQSAYRRPVQVPPSQRDPSPPVRPSSMAPRMGGKEKYYAPRLSAFSYREVSCNTQTVQCYYRVPLCGKQNPRRTRRTRKTTRGQGNQDHQTRARPWDPEVKPIPAPATATIRRRCWYGACGLAGLSACWGTVTVLSCTSEQ